MKKLLPIFFLAFVVSNSFAQTELNVMTFNIRFDTKSDSLNAWPYRKDKAASQILFHKAHIIGLQEAFSYQVTDLKDRLPNYSSVGVGRTDGKEKGEFSAILYDTLRLQVLQSQTFWLSEHPDSIGRKGWDAAFERIVTWAKFRDKKTKKVFYHFNTHFDHIGKVARRESAKLILQKVQEITGATQTIITGDFNATPGDEPILVLTNNETKNRLIDTKAISKQKHYGPEGTFNAFQSKEINNFPIDYIFIKGPIEILQHATLSQTWEGRFSSDHFPVYAVLRLK